MIYGFAYLGMVLFISAGWVVLAVLKKPNFIEKPLQKFKKKIRPFLTKKEDEWKDYQFCYFFILITLIIFNKSTIVFPRNLLEKNISQKVIRNWLAEKYGDSVSKNLFMGLNNEQILKYEYLFSSIPEKSIQKYTKFIVI